MRIRNLCADADTIYTYNINCRLSKFDNNTFAYGANGIRYRKNNTVYTLNGNKILRESDGTKTLTYYHGGSGIVGFEYNGTDYYFRKSIQGDVITIVDKNAQTVAKYSYDAWGVCDVTFDCTAVGIATINPYRYRGYFFDKETGLYYLQSRYYNASVGRFVNGDETAYLSASGTILGYNLFAYCENDIVNNSNESGAISLNAVMSFLKTFMKVIKNIVGWVKKIIAGLLSLYMGFSPGDISSIAKDIGRSPHRVRQAIESIVKKLGGVKSSVGKFALGVSILAMIASIGEKITRLGNIAKIIAECVVEAVSSFLQWALSKGLKALLSIIPAVGSILGFFAKSIVSLLFKIFLTDNKIKALKQKITSRIEMVTYDLTDYFMVFFKSLA